MLSRSETIRQALSEMTPQEGAEAPASFSGPVAQVNIISHATIHVGSMQIVTDGELWTLNERQRPKGRKRKGRKGKVTRLQPWPERP